MPKLRPSTPLLWGISVALVLVLLFFAQRNPILENAGLESAPDSGGPVKRARAPLDAETSRRVPPATLDCPDLVESSGICVDDRGVLWTHNDSGATPMLYAFAADGRWLAQVVVANAEAEDWEDLCFVQRDGVSYIAIGDVGDNSENRKSISIHVIEQPMLELPSEGRGGVLDLKVPRVGHLQVKYPSGPVNCESLAYDPVRREFLLPSKEALRCRLFQVDASGLLGKRELVAQKSPQVASIPLVTGADISRDGRQLVLATYGPGCMLTRAPDGQHWQINASPGMKIFELPVRTQGESICFTPDARQLLLTSEFSPTPLYRIATPEMN